MTWRAKRIILGLGAVVLVGLWFFTPAIEFGREMARSAWVAVSSRVINSDFLNSPDEVEEKIEYLMAENIRLKAELTDYKLLRQELAAPAFDDFQPVMAIVSGRPLNSFRSELIINKGEKDGINVGMPAITRASVLVGFVTEVYEDNSIVTLSLHPSMALAVDILNNEEVRVQGLVEGRYYTTIRLTTVPRDLPLESAQAVITQGKSGEIPYGLLVGTTKDIINDQSGVYKEATLHLPYDPEKLRGMILLKPS